MSFFSSLFQVLEFEFFSYCTFTETFAIGFQKWFDHEWIDFEIFRWNLSFLLTSNLHGLKFAWIPQVCFPFDDIKSIWWLVWGVFWSVLLMCPFFSAIEFSNIDWCAVSMQSKITSYVRVSSSVSFVASIDEETINFSENHIDCFPSFFILTVCWCSTQFTEKVVFSKITNPFFYCTCPSVAPLLREFFLWSAETRRNFNILSCINVLDLVLKCCSDIKEGEWIHYSLTSLCWWMKLHCWLELVFFICGSRFSSKFSRIALLRKCSRMDSKTVFTSKN